MPKTGSLHQQAFISPFWRLGSPRPRRWRIWCLVCRQVPSCYNLTAGRERGLWSFPLFIRTLITSQVLRDSTLRTSSKPNYLTKVPPPGAITLEIQTSTYERRREREGKHSAHSKNQAHILSFLNILHLSSSLVFI